MIMTTSTYDLNNDYTTDPHDDLIMGDHPFQQGAAYSKDELLRGMKRPSSNDWTGMQTSMWIRKALEANPSDSPSRAKLLRQQQENNKFSPNLPKESTSCEDRRKDSCAPDMAPQTTTHENFEAVPSSRYAAPDHFNETNMFHFDLRQRCGGDKFQRWISESPEYMDHVHGIRIKHWTWILNNKTSSWSAIDDETVFSLLPSGDVKVTRSQGLDHPQLCHCDDKRQTSHNDKKSSTPWSIGDFAQALAQDDTELIHLAEKFVELMEEHDETYEPVDCKKCRNAMFYLRIYRIRSLDEDLIPAPLRVSCAAPPPIPPKAASRASRTISSGSSSSSAYSTAPSSPLSTPKSSCPPEEATEFHQVTYDILNTLDSQDINPPISPLSGAGAGLPPSLRLEIPATPLLSPDEASHSLRAFLYTDYPSENEEEEAEPRSAMSDESRIHPYCINPTLSLENLTTKVEASTSRNLTRRLTKRFSSFNLKDWTSSGSGSPITVVSRRDSGLEFPESPKSAMSGGSSLLKGRFFGGLRRK